MISSSLIITMLGIGVGCGIGETILIAVGKSDLARFIGITGLACMGTVAVGFSVELISKLAQL